MQKVDQVDFKFFNNYLQHFFLHINQICMNFALLKIKARADPENFSRGILRKNSVCQGGLRPISGNFTT